MYHNFDNPPELLPEEIVVATVLLMELPLLAQFKLQIQAARDTESKLQLDKRENSSCEIRL